MAIRPFTFGVRLRDKGRTVKVRQDAKSGRYIVEDSKTGPRTARRSHGTLGSAIQDAATTWRSRLH